jgi:Tol biopolymer transport system component
MTPPHPPRQPDQAFFPLWEKLLRFGWVGAALVVVALAFFFWKRNRAEVHVPEVRFASTTQWTTENGVTISPVVSRDGKLVAYASDRGGSGNLAIWLRPYPSGGEPRRINDDPYNQTDPDLSPDARQVVYHSDRDGGGIYIASASAGSQPKLLAAGGFRPRFSPDGRWVAYYTAPGDDAVPGVIHGSRIYIVPVQLGDPKQLRPEFLSAQTPVWSPDGQRLLFEGSDEDGSRDWWVTPLTGGEAVRTHAFDRLGSQVGTHLSPERWIGDKILFPAAPEANLHLWELSITPQIWKAAGLPRQITDGDWIEQAGSIAPNGKLLFTRMRVTVDIWSLPLGASGAASADKLRRLTDDHGLDQTPSVAARHAKMIYLSNKSGVRDLWLADFKTHSEQALTAFQNVGYRPILSPDGKRVAYRTTAQGRCTVVMQGLEMTQQKQLIPGCFNIWDWSPEGSSLLGYDASRTPISADLVRIDTGQREPLISSPSRGIFDAEFSPDGSWVAFSAGASLGRAEVFVAHYHGAAIHESEWIPITHGGGSLSAWSPSGELLYFQSKRDGFHCVWAQSLSSAKHPVGEPAAILHLHTVAFGMYMIKPADFRMSVTPDALILNLAKENANIWITGKEE